ncbi:MAG: BlaI/MecI/CopY family transcriptional regulator [Bacteroidia bacterium]|nr:BlaI/MecI/CopY family transcriptional regulator [Bacteroidia bacterium]
MKTLTKAEEQVMQHLWSLQKAFLKDLMDSFEDPKPAYTTISTMVRILIEKEFIGFHQYGNNREYYPLITRENYLKGQFRGVLKSYFQGSFSKFASFYTGKENISIEELEEIRMLIQEEINNRKDTNHE